MDTGSREENASKQKIEPRSDSIGTEKALSSAIKRPGKSAVSGEITMKFSLAALSAAASVGLSVVLALASFAASAADYPAPKQGDWIAKDFKFHTGQTMPEFAAALHHHR